jgi:predicted nucleic acid-binding protein
MSGTHFIDTNILLYSISTASGEAGKHAIAIELLDREGGALSIKAAHGLSYWDSAIVAAACAQGCQEILTEDLSHGRQLEGVREVNPFRRRRQAWMRANGTPGQALSLSLNQSR